MVDYFIRNPVESNPKIINFDNTIRKCGEFNRKLPYDIFKRKLLNGEIKIDNGCYTQHQKTHYFVFTAFFFLIKKHSLVPPIQDLLIGKNVLKKLNNTKRI